MKLIENNDQLIWGLVDSSIPKEFPFDYTEEDVKLSREILLNNYNDNPSGIKLQFFVKIKTTETKKRNLSVVFYKNPIILNEKTINDYKIKFKQKVSDSGFEKYEIVDNNFEKKNWCNADSYITLCEEVNGCISPIYDINGIVVQTKISLGYADGSILKDLYDGICGDAQNRLLDANILSAFERVKNVVKGKRSTYLYSDQYDMYLRIVPILEEILNVVKYIYKNLPFKISKVNKIVNETELKIIKGSHGGRILSTISRYEVMQYHVSYLVRDFHIFENIYLKQVIIKCTSQIQNIILSLKEYVKELEAKMKVLEGYIIYNELRSQKSLHEIAISNIENYQNILLEYLKNLEFIVDRNTSQYTDFFSELFTYDVYYKRLKYYNNVLDQIINIDDLSSDKYKYEVVPFNQLYQKWSFAKVIEALYKLGFTSRQEPLHYSFYKSPIHDQINYIFEHMQLQDITLKVWYEKYCLNKNRTKSKDHPKYKEIYGVPHLSELPSAQSSSYTLKDSPDILIEIFDRTGRIDHPILVTLDPTLRPNDTSKHHYFDSIRYFEKRDKDGEPLRIVRAAWAIQPPSSYTQNFSYKLSSTFEKGFIFLDHRPESFISLTDTLKNIINWSLKEFNCGNL